MKKFLLIIFAFLSCQCFSQGNVISITSNAPAQFAVCGPAKVFTISIYNPSPYLLTNDTLKLNMPVGIVYQIGSITGANELFTNVPNQPVFLLANIPTLSTLNITFSAAASCGLIQYISGGGVIENFIRVDYTANNIHNYDTYTSPYTVRQPSLSITSVTNQSFSGSLGAVFSRCITITNSGSGELSQFTFTDIHGSGIQINTINNGVWVNSGNTETVNFNAGNFNSIGNNNGLFEQGESITLCETVTVSNCSAVSSDFTAGWGCSGQICQSAISSANVVFPNLIPNLQITPINIPMNDCLGAGNPSLQQLKIVNIGLGQATNIQLDIYQSNGMGYNSYFGSNIYENSFTIQIGSSAPAAIAPDSSQNTDQMNCMSANAKGRVFITIPSINSGETVYVRFNTYSCCYNSCTQIGQSYFNGWAFKGSYSNVCQSPYLIYETWGRIYSQLFASLANSNSSPSYLDSGQTGTFNFLFSSYIFQQPYPGNSTAHWKLLFTFPAPCLGYSGNLNIISPGGTPWNPSSVSVSGNTATAIFNGQPPFSLDQAVVNIDLGVNCVGCSGDPGNVEIKAIYVPSTSCSCEVVAACQSTSVTVLCSAPACRDSILYCPNAFIYDTLFCDQNGIHDTLIYLYCHDSVIIRNCDNPLDQFHPPVCPDLCRGITSFYDLKRTSYGLPDNEPGGGNGLPDPGGSLNFAEINTNRAMFGDTITAGYYGVICTNPAHPFWQYLYASSSFTNGNLLSFQDAELYIYRGGTLLAVCSNFSPTIYTTGTTRSFKYNLSAAGLISSGCLPNGFTYLNNDFVLFKPRYKVTVNTLGPIFNCKANDTIYLSDIPNPISTINKFYDPSSINNQLHQCFIIGYRFISNDESYYNARSCDNFTAVQNYGLSIGPCCNNYNGGNLFPFEYRNWAHIKILKAIVPPGYSFVSAQFFEKRTAGTGVSVTSPSITLIPANPNSDTLLFPVEQYFQGYGGTIPLGDDGFFGTLNVTLMPSCKVTPVLSQGIKDDWTFAPTGYLTGSGSYPAFISVTQDYVIYEAPALLLQAILPSVSVPDSTAVWDVNISNTSNVSNGMNTWLTAPSISGVSVIQVLDLDNNVIVPPTGGFYQLGVVNAASIRNFRIKAFFTSCSQDSIILYSGWNCAGYPDSLASYPCTPQKITLKEIPLLPVLDLTVASPPGSVDLCDTTTFIVEGLNFQLGTLYNVMLSTALPLGLNIVPGSCKLSYPNNSLYNAIPDPAFVSGTLWEWNLSAINNLIGNNGLRGVLDTNLNSFKIIFKAVTNCSYTSGSTIHFRLSGNAACGLYVVKEISSLQLFVTGAESPYSTDITLQTSYLSPCAANSIMHVSFINHGPLASGASDSISILLPFGVSYVNGSFSGIHNAPANPVPTQFLLNGQTFLMWKIPQNLQQGDSLVFTFNYAGSAADLSCGISNFYANTLSSAGVVCTSTGNACNIKVLTGQDTLPVFIYLANLSLSNPGGYTIPNPPAGETASISFTINNTGQNVFPANNTIVSYYFDSDANGFYNSGDVFIVNDTQNVSIPSNGNYPYSANINIPAGNACSVIALLDTAVTHCSCTPSQLVINLPMKNIGIDTILCSGDSISLGFPPINSYTYSWSPSAGLSDPASSSPIFTGINTSALPVTYTFIVTADRINCVSKDTVNVTLYPNPAFSITGTDTICFGANNGIAAVISLVGGTAPYSFLWNTLPVQINDTAVNLSAGNYSNTVTDANGCSAIHTFDIYQPNTGLSASIASQSNITCNTLCNGSANVTASGGLGNYTFSWNTIPIQTTALVSGLCAGNYTVTVSDNNSSGCTASASLIINEPPILTAGVSVFNPTCNGGNNATATVTAGGGTGSYTYLWSDGQTTAIAAGLSPGTYTITVSDSNLCTKTAAAVVGAAVQVTAVPASANICVGQSTSINAVTTGGAPSYSFLWNTSQTTQSIIVSPTANSSYTVTVTDNNGCIDSSIVQINVHPNPIVNFTANNKAGCEPLCLSFQDSSFVSAGSVTQWLWDLGDSSAASHSQTFDHCYTNDSVFSPVSYTVTLTVTSDYGCTAAISKNNYITVYPNPNAVFSIQPQTATIAAPLISITNLSSGADFWNWNFGDLETSSIFSPSFHTYKDTGTYHITLIATTQYGCADTAYQTIVIEPDFIFYIPNSFSPNDDGINDFFTGKGLFIAEFEMSIFDRWGNFIFFTDNIKKPWDGKANHGADAAQEDVYVYVVKVTDYKMIKHKFKGIVTLVR